MQFSRYASAQTVRQTYILIAIFFPPTCGEVTIATEFVKIMHRSTLTDKF